MCHWGRSQLAHPVYPFVSLFLVYRLASVIQVRVSLTPYIHEMLHADGAPIARSPNHINTETPLGGHLTIVALRPYLHPIFRKGAPVRMLSY